MKILIVGGTWTAGLNADALRNRESKLVSAAYNAAQMYCKEKYGTESYVELHNGGYYDYLEALRHKTANFDVVFWWANVPDNGLPKVRNVKDIAPYTMLVTSKRNDGDKYTFMELTQRALHIKANLFFEFKKTEDKLFHINVFDPLGCHWYDGFDIAEAMNAALTRLDYLKNVTRQKTIQSDISKTDVLDSFLNRTNDNTCHSDREVNTPDENEFIEIVKKHAETFYTIFNPGKDVKRFLGNASLRAQLNIDATRCMRGMPSFKKDNIIFVSQRNIDKQFISLENFAPCYMEEGELYYCGDHKPSVDAPVQVRLYEALPHINYIIHSHCYIKDARFTTKTIPCGAIEEVGEVLEVIKAMDQEYLEMTKGTRGFASDAKPFMYAINLRGHGSLLLATNASMMKNIEYVGRQLPEIMFD